MKSPLLPCVNFETGTIKRLLYRLDIVLGGEALHNFGSVIKRLRNRSVGLVTVGRAGEINKAWG